MCFIGKAFGNVAPLDIRHLFRLWAKRLCNQDKYPFLGDFVIKVGLKQKGQFSGWMHAQNCVSIQEG